MHRITLYIVFILSCIVVVVLFVTATTYTQVAAAALLYPGVAYLALQILVSKHKRSIPPTLVDPQGVPQPKPKIETLVAVQEESEKEKVVDIDKRTFVKLVGATGLFFLVSSVMGKKLGTLFFNQTPQNEMAPNASTTPPAPGSTTALTTSGYNITDIDEGDITYYGFTNNTGAWIIMKDDTNSNSFRYARGDSNFPDYWAKRQSLKYDYYYNLF